MCKKETYIHTKWKAKKESKRKGKEDNHHSKKERNVVYDDKVALDPYRQSVTFGGEVPQGEGDVGEHDDVTDEDGGHVVLTLSLQLVLNTSLGVEGNVHVVSPFLIFCHLLHEVDEPVN